MGNNLEKESRVRRQRGFIRDAVFGTIAVSGLILVAAVAPNTLQVLDCIPGLKKYRANEKIKSALSSLSRRGLVVFETRGGKRYARITERGKKRLLIERQKALLLSARPKRWDKRWRIVMFDIPERRRGTRDELRNTMKDAGFARFQDSAWIYPYDCEDFIALLKADLHLGNAVRYVIADTIENDVSFRASFGIR
jgi:DNA-binding transcriptional regulator PaaX